jgi:serine protease AprX
MRRSKTRSAMWGRWVVTMCALLLTASFAFAGRRKIAPDLQNAKPGSRVNVIVQFNKPISSAMHEKVIRRGGKLRRELRLIRSGAYSLSASEVSDLATDPDVAYISLDRPVHSLGTGRIVPAIDYHNETMNTPWAWEQGLDGSGIGVAVIDSGIANVSDLDKNRVVYSQDFVGDNGGSSDDLYGHGTHVSGIIAGTGKNSRGLGNQYTFQGIAPGVNLIDLRVLDSTGAGTDSEVINAIQTAIQLKNTYNIRVINLSLGRGVYESYTQDPLCQAVEQAWQAGIVVVVSAGNEGRNDSAGTNGYGTITAPGNDPYVITVGAMNTMDTPDRTDDIPASYSSKGPSLFDQVVKPDLVAPGNLIVSLYTPPETLNQENPGNEVPYSVYQSNGNSGNSTNYFVLSGTSMAAPMVSGTAALMLEQNPNLTPDQVKAILMLTAFKGLQQYSIAVDPVSGQTFDEQADIFTVGAGYVDAQAALTNTVVPPGAFGSAMSPFATIDSNGNVILVNGTPVSGATVIWGGSTPWANTVIWGGSLSGADDAGQTVIWGGSSVVSDTVIWGGSTTQGATVIWGGSTAQGATVIWGGSTAAAETVAHGDRH